MSISYEIVEADSSSYKNNYEEILDNGQAAGILKLGTTFLWEISNLNCLIGNRRKLYDVESVRSVEFGVESHKSMGWHLVLNLKDSKNYVGLYLKSLSKLPQTANFKFHILNEHNRLVATYDGGTQLFQPKQEIGIYEFASKSDLLDRCNTKLTILCELSMQFQTEHRQVMWQLYSKGFQDIHKYELGDHFDVLVDGKSDGDVKFLVDDDVVFHAHRVVLSARSRVFAKMLRDDDDPRETIRIDDVDPPTFRELLRFIYTGRVYGMRVLAVELLKAAQQYAMDDLLPVCEAYFSDELTHENAFEFLELADEFGLSQLKNEIIQYIIEYAEEIVNDSEYDQLNTLPTNLLVDMFSALVYRKREAWC